MKKQLIFLFVLLFFFLGVIGFSCYILLTTETEPEVLEEYGSYADLQEEVTVPVPDETDGDDSVYLSFDLEELLSTNPDFDCWLMIPDTEISFPVVHTTDNFYYLDRAFDKSPNIYGCLYFDVLGTPDSENRVIHGHNMGNNRKEMFSTLVNYQEQEFAETHTIAYLAKSPEEPASVYELFAVVNFDIANNYPLDYAQPDFATPEEKAEFVAHLQRQSVYKTDYVPEGRLLILSTCNRVGGPYNRLLICLSEQVPEAKTENPA